MFFEHAILLAYATTVISEVAIILLLQKPKNILLWVVAILLVNSLTHPLAVYCFHIRNMPYLCVEACVCIIEAIWYRIALGIPWRKGFLLSLIANIFSILMGILIRIFIL